MDWFLYDNGLLHERVKEFFSKCDQIRRFLRIWSHLLTKSLVGNFIFCANKEKCATEKMSPNLKENYLK